MSDKDSESTDTEFSFTLTNDYAFKRVMGAEENKEALQDFLECVLALPAGEISALELLDKELTKNELTDKTGVLDVKVRLKSGELIDIEIQTSWNASFVKRTLFYWAKMYTSEFKAGQSYESLHKCITINIIANSFPLNNAVHSEYVIVEKESHKPLTDVLEIHFLNLQAAKQAKDEGKQENKQKQLINWLKFIGARDKEERAMLAETSPVLQLLNEKLDVMTLDPIEKKLYESRMKLKSDIVTISESQFKAGIEQGIEQGARQKALETARKLLEMGLSDIQIKEATGLSEEEIEQL